ncbi:hypothetical protein NXS19_006402 [Fusarium pseudograminearum]|nr:hypothetical protein NXS19_006402 [Fusarium pseudograminearum]
MASIEPNYFTCTLGQAALLKNKHGSAKWKTVLELIDHQAQNIPDSPAVGFATFKHLKSSQVSPYFLTFQSLSESSKHAAQILSQLLPQPKGSSHMTIGLLAASTTDFVLTWLGLMRLGYTVLLLAPQLAPPAITHLCQILHITQVLVDKMYEHRARGLDNRIDVTMIPRYHPADPSTTSFKQADKTSDIAYICHTSGTSSGLPKPIPQTQFGVMGALYSFPGKDKPATFSTTPLYHGGFPDCLRSWTSGAAIWFFPEGHAPITGSNILKALQYARDKSPSPVQYFSSVPYVLQMLSEEYEGLEILQSMDLVGVGGAAPPLR